MIAAFATDFAGEEVEVVTVAEGGSTGTAFTAGAGLVVVGVEDAVTTGGDATTVACVPDAVAAVAGRLEGATTVGVAVGTGAAATAGQR